MKESWSLDKRDTAFIHSLFPLWSWIYEHYFHVRSDGWHHIPNKKVLLVGSHNGGLASPDLHMLIYDWYRRFGAERPVYGLMHAKMWELAPFIGEHLSKLGAVVAHPKVAMQAFDRGASVLVFPGGGQDVFRPFHEWDKIKFVDRKGFIKLALKQKVPIIPIVSVGAHHTLIVLADIYPILKELHKMGMPWPFGIDPEVMPVSLSLPLGLTIGSTLNIPMPVPIFIRICPPIYLHQNQTDKLINDKDFVDECYNKVVTTMQQSLDELIQETPYR